MLEIKDEGNRMVSGFLAEIGNSYHFNSLKELQKLTGLALVKTSAGKYNGDKV